MRAHPYKNQPLRARLGFALRGLAEALRSEASLKAQLLLGAAVLIALLLLRPPALWWALVLLAGAAVLSAELMNSAIERLADELGGEQQERIRIIKDCAAAAVLCAALGALAVAVALAAYLLNK